MKASAFTAESVLVVLIAWCAFDGLLELTLGNEWTISWTLLGIESHHPIFGVLLCYTLNTLVGHLLLPHFGAVPAWREWVGAVIGLAPIVAAFGYIGVHPGGTDVAVENLQRLFRCSEWRWYGVLVLTAAAGQLNGKICVPQHVF